MTSRDRIMGRLRAARQPFADTPPLAERRAMVPIEDTSPAGLQRRFTREAENLGCTVHSVASAAQGVRQILNLLGSDTAVLSWDLAHIRCPAYRSARRRRIPRAVDDPSVRVGSPAHAGLVGTGGLVLTTAKASPAWCRCSRWCTSPCSRPAGSSPPSKRGLRGGGRLAWLGAASTLM